MPFYEFQCPECGRGETHPLPWAKLAEAAFYCEECCVKLVRRFSVVRTLMYRTAAELAEMALRGETTVPGLTAKESRETAAGMARDRKRR